ncbi:hypothetical protein DICPUDRAFT_16805, partial [Dictyostelium purpureum]
TTTTTNTTTNTTNTTISSIGKDNLKLWVGNLPIGSTEKEIREFFSGFEIDLIKMTEMTESQLACAVVQFFDHESASLARENNLSSTFKGNKLIINWSNSPPTLSPLLSSSKLTPNDPSNQDKEQQHHYHPYPSYQHHHHHRTVYYNQQQHTSQITTTNVNISPPKPPLQHSATTPVSSSSSSSSLHNIDSTKEKVTDCDPRVNRKLFLGLTYEGESIEDLRNRFGKYGKVEEVVISASGLAFLRFYNTESAILAKRDLGFRYKIQFDKKEPRDTQYYDPNGPPSFYGDRPPPLLDAIEYGRNETNRQPSIPPPQTPSDFYRDSYRDLAHNKNSYYNERPPPPPVSAPLQPPVTPPLVAPLFSEPLSTEEYNQFYSFLENLKATNLSIRESKDWFILHLKSGKPIVQLINRYITNTSNNPVYNKLEVIYLINDILYFGLVRRLNPDSKDPISDLFEPYLPSILSSFNKESQLLQNNCLKVLEFWEEKHYYPLKAIQAFRN